MRAHTLAPGVVSSPRTRPAGTGASDPPARSTAMVVRKTTTWARAAFQPSRISSSVGGGGGPANMVASVWDREAHEEGGRGEERRGKKGGAAGG